MADTLNQYKSSLTAEEVDRALHDIAYLNDGIDQAQQYAEQARQYADSIDPDSFVKGDALLNLVYPVGSIYMSANNVSPQTFLGGTWQPIQGRFLLGADTSYTAGSTGGEALHTLTETEMPAHIHNRIVTDTKPDVSLTRGTGTYTDTSSTSSAYGPWYGSGFSYQGVARTNSAGGGQPHNNMPPYLAVYIWKRTA